MNPLTNPPADETEAGAPAAETDAVDLDAPRKELADQKVLNLNLPADFEKFRRRNRQEAETRAAAQKESFIQGWVLRNFRHHI
jgi:molecular chaperone GrpE (heat shock protein)